MELSVMKTMVVGMIEKATEEFFNPKENLEKEKVILSDKAEGIRNFINKGRPFECKTEKVAELMSILLGEEIISEKDRKADYMDTRFVGVIQLKEVDSSGYILDTGSFCLSMDDEVNPDSKVLTGYDSSGDEGNNVFPANYRRANTEEITKFVEDNMEKLRDKEHFTLLSYL